MVCPRCGKDNTKMYKARGGVAVKIERTTDGKVMVILFA